MNRRCKYHCVVEDAEGSPSFTIRVDDDEHEEPLLFRGKTPRGKLQTWHRVPAWVARSGRRLLLLLVCLLLFVVCLFVCLFLQNIQAKKQLRKKNNKMKQKI